MLKRSLTILKLALPVMVSQISLILVAFADNIMVGRYSTDALAASSFVINVFNLVIFCAMGFSYGLTPIVGAMFARGEKKNIGVAVRAALRANIVMGVLLSAVMGVLFFFVENLGQPGELMPILKPYYLIFLAGLLPMAVFNVFAQWSFGVRNTSMPMWILLGANMLNIVGNYMLIYGNWGAPELGLTGAGISTLVSRWICPIVIICIFFLRKHNREYRDGFIHSRFNRESLRQLNITSWPVALQLGFETGSFSFSAVMAGWIGPIELAAFQVMVVVGSLGFCFYYSLGSATSVLVANAAGRGDHAAMRRVGFAGYHLTLLMAVCASLAFALAGRQLIGLFTTDPAVIATALSLIVPLILYQLGDATQVNFANALRGTSHVMPMLWIAFISYVVVGIPCTYCLGFILELGIYGIFLSFSASLFLAAGLFLYFFMKHTSKRNANTISQ